MFVKLIQISRKIFLNYLNLMTNYLKLKEIFLDFET